jgi:hypothetical protein
MQAPTRAKWPAEHYMAWMGRLPMIMHPRPRRALVICFGTGQTANAVRREKPAAVDIVDINRNVFALGKYFPANENVLSDPEVTATVMDGRAFIRRTHNAYDVITLEPMPPTFAGVNALYSREFYAMARAKMTPDGVIAQWLPFHLVTPRSSAAIARTFMSVFPNALLWIDPASNTGILIGTKNDHDNSFGKKWPGYARAGIRRDMTEKQARKQVMLGKTTLARYAADGGIISDDNQLLAYGPAAWAYYFGGSFMEANMAGLRKAQEISGAP